MLEKKKAIIFDLDGSLVDSMWIWPEVDRLYLEKYRLTPPADFQAKIDGMSFTETAQYFLDIFPELTFTLEDVKKEWVDMTKELYATRVQLKPGAGDFLKWMHSCNMLMGIATSNARELVDAVLDALDIRNFFSAIRTSCEVAAGKPAPDVYLKVAQDLQVEPECCLVFEDIPNGIMAGKNAGMSVCAVDDDYSKTETPQKRKLADYFIYDYHDIGNHTYEICGRA